MQITTLILCTLVLIATGLPLINSAAWWIRILDFPRPLDHIFYSREFGLLTLKKLEDFGSDHFPLLIGLHYEPDDDNIEGLENTSAVEEAEVEEKIEEGKKESSD